MRDALFLAISQSGRSPDLLTLAEAARADGALTVALVNDTASPLAALCEVVLPLHAGPEKSVAATKSYHRLARGAACSSSPTGARTRTARRALQRLPDDLAEARGLRLVGGAAGAARRRDNLYRRRPRRRLRASAQEAALKLKETCGIHAEALSAAELMHGPLALAGAGFPGAGLQPARRGLDGLAELGRELAARGVPVIAAGPARGPGDACALPSASDAQPLRPADRADPELLSARRSASPAPAAATRTGRRTSAR